MNDGQNDLTNLTHDLVEQAAALAHAVVPDLATASEAADLVDLVVTLDVELRFGASPPLAHATLERLIAVASELYGRVEFGHVAGMHALTVVTSAEGLAHALRQRPPTPTSAPTPTPTPFRRVRREDCVAMAG